MLTYFCIVIARFVCSNLGCHASSLSCPCAPHFKHFCWKYWESEARVFIKKVPPFLQDDRTIYAFSHSLFISKAFHRIIGELAFSVTCIFVNVFILICLRTLITAKVFLVSSWNCTLSFPTSHLARYLAIFSHSEMIRKSFVSRNGYSN